MPTNPSFLPGNKSSENDVSLWDSFRNGDKQSYELIFSKYVRLLYRYGGKITANKSIVEDCIQEIFMDLWSNRESIGTTSSIKFYLFASLRRKLSRKLKKELWHKNLFSRYDALPFEIEFAFESEMIDKDLTLLQKKHLEAALIKLSKREREVIYLKFYEDMPHKEIASVLDMKLMSVYSLVGKAIAKLRKAFDTSLYKRHL